MASKISIISLFVVLLAAFCYSAPIENFNNTIPFRRNDIPTTTVAEIHEVNMHLVPDDATGLPPIRKTRSIEDPKSEEFTTQETVADPPHSFDEREALTHPADSFDEREALTHPADSFDEREALTHPADSFDEREAFTHPADSFDEREAFTHPADSFDEREALTIQGRVADSSRPLEEFTPPSAEEFTPPSAEEFTPPSAEEFTPPSAEEFTPPSVEKFTPPSAEEFTPRSFPEGEVLTTQKPKSSPAQSSAESESDELTTQGHVSRPKHDQRTLDVSTFDAAETSTALRKGVVLSDRLESTTPHGSFHEDFWGLSATREPTSTDQIPKRSLGEDNTFTSEPSSTTQSSVFTPHLTYNEIVVPGNVRVTAFNGTASSEHISNHLSQGEKQPFAPDS